MPALEEAVASLFKEKTEAVLTKHEPGKYAQIKGKSDIAAHALPFLLYAGMIADRYDNQKLKSDILNALKTLAASDAFTSVSNAAAASYAASIRKEKEAAWIFEAYKPDNKRKVDDYLRFVIQRFAFKLANPGVRGAELSGELAAAIKPYAAIRQLEGDLVWMNAAVAILNGSFAASAQDIKAIDNAKLRNPDTLANFMADLIAFALCSKQISPAAASDLIEIVEGKLRAGTAAAPLWRKLAFLELSRALPDLQKSKETLNRLLQDARLSALPSYPSLMLLKMAAESSSASVSEEILKGNYRMFIADSPVASDADSAMALVFTSDDPVSVITDMLESSPENAFCAGIAAYMFNKGKPETSKRILAKLKELQHLFSWEERLCIKNLE